MAMSNVHCCMMAHSLDRNIPTTDSNKNRPLDCPPALDQRVKGAYSLVGLHTIHGNKPVIIPLDCYWQQQDCSMRGSNPRLWAHKTHTLTN